MSERQKRFNWVFAFMMAATALSLFQGFLCSVYEVGKKDGWAEGRKDAEMERLRQERDEKETKL